MKRVRETRFDYRMKIPLLVVMEACCAVVLFCNCTLLHNQVLGQERSPDEDLVRMEYNHPGLVVDLGVGLWAWPMPIDWDSDGDLDLVVSCPCKPYNGIFFFENPTPPGKKEKFPVFRPAVRVGPGMYDLSISYPNGKPEILAPGLRFVEPEKNHFLQIKTIYPRQNVFQPAGRLRGNQWKYVDLNGDAAQDLIVGMGDWTDYGWDDAYDSQGNWTNGPLHGWIFWLRNLGTTEQPRYAEPVRLEAAEKPIDLFGMPSPNFGDFDGDGDLDLLCGEFLDSFSYYENAGDQHEFRFLAPRKLSHQGKPLIMDLEMITPTAIDWDQDQDLDLIVGDEDGRVAFVEHTGKVVQGMPQFLPPVYFRQEAQFVKCGALATPVAVDWDEDGDVDLVSGNTAGYIEFFENLSGSKVWPARWNSPVRLKSEAETIRIQAGPNGSIQGPCEAKWGYTTLSVADWDHDGRYDLVINSIWGKVQWYRNIGTKGKPHLAAVAPVEVQWPTGTQPPKPQWTWWNPQEKELATQWRTTPVVTDWNDDGLHDLVMLDHEGYLTMFRRQKVGDALHLLPSERLFVDKQGQPLQFNAGRAGKSGRRKLTVVDWDGDGRKDILANSINADWWQNVESRDGKTVLINRGSLARQDISSHTASPTTADFDGDGQRELIMGAEDGFFYYLPKKK